MTTFGTTLGRALGALITCSLVGLTGCADPGPVASAPTTSPSVQEPAPSASPSVPEPSPPETAKEFLRRWVSLQNDMQVTGETDAYRRNSLMCGTCTAFAERIEEIYAAGGSIQTTGWRIRTVLSARGTARAKVIEAVVDSGSTRYIEKRGGGAKSLPGGRLTEQFELRRRDGAWQMFEYSEVAS